MPLKVRLHQRLQHLPLLKKPLNQQVNNTTIWSFNDDDTTDVDVILDLHVARRCPEFELDQIPILKELSDYVTVRLALARAKAMQVYYEKWT
jgi:hypothetical protein